MTHEGYAGEKARRNVYQIMMQAAKEEKYMLSNPNDLDDILEIMHEGTSPPKTIEYKKDGKFFKVMKRSWA
jgi:hypothetical protein